MRDVCTVLFMRPGLGGTTMQFPVRFDVRRNQALVGQDVSKIRLNAVCQQTSGILAPLSGVPERDAGVFPETEQFALAVKAVSHPPELAAAGGHIEEQAAAVEIFAGFHVGFQTADVGIGKRHGHSLVVVGRRDTHMDKNMFDSVRLSV